MLKIDIRPGETLKIGDAIVKLVHKSGQVACLVIDAPKSVEIQREKAKEGTACRSSLPLQA